MLIYLEFVVVTYITCQAKSPIKYLNVILILSPLYYKCHFIEKQYHKQIHISHCLSDRILKILVPASLHHTFRIT